MPQNEQRQSVYRIFGNVAVLPWFTAGHVALAGGLGGTFLALSAVFAAWSLLPAVTFFLLAALCVLPGIRSVGITAPQDCRRTALLSFMKQSLLFLPAWSASLLSCLLVFGLFCKAWRLGLAVSRSPENCYTAFPDGRIVRVSRVTEELPRTLYRDAEGNLYRPPLRFKSTTHSP